MQVKKYEAKTIKEAIEMVKFELGPEAVILSAKEVSKGGGLMGGPSFEVTAAISDQKLREKKVAENKMSQKMKIKFQHGPAKSQKEFIEKVTAQKAYDAQVERTQPAKSPQKPSAPRPVTQVPYIDIDDNAELSAKPAPIRPSPQLRHSVVLRNPAISTKETAPEVSVLKNEIQQLRKVVEQFQRVPQSIISYHPGAAEGIPYELSFTLKKLMEAGMFEEHAIAIMKLANEALPAEQKKKKGLVDAWVIKYLLDNLNIATNPEKPKFHIFLGSTGQGKTSTVVKMAAHYVLKERKKVAVLAGDSIKVGAQDQLKFFAQVLNVPFAKINSREDWISLKSDFEHFDHILFDSPGVTLRGNEELETLRNVLPPDMRGMAVHYVQSVLARDSDAFEIADRFKIIGFQDLIFTRLDEAVQHGIMWNFQQRYSVPLHSFGIGPRLPEDFEYATRERFVDLIFNLSKMAK